MEQNRFVSSVDDDSMAVVANPLQLVSLGDRGSAAKRYHEQ